MELRLPDDLRDALERALDVALLPDGTEAENVPAAKQAVTEILFADPTSHPQWAPFLQQFKRATDGMIEGSSTPVVRITNLPEKNGQWASNALANALGGMARGSTQMPLTISDTMHQDFCDSVANFNPTVDHEVTIRSIYCSSPGNARVPTLFATADEVLQVETCRRLGMRPNLNRPIPPEAADAYAQAHSALVEELSKRTIKEKMPGFPAGTIFHAALSRNPHYNADSKREGAPEFFFGHHVGESKDELSDMAERVRPYLRGHSKATTEANTLVLWNDALVLHDKARRSSKGRCGVFSTMRTIVPGLLTSQGDPGPLSAREREARYQVAMGQPDIIR